MLGSEGVISENSFQFERPMQNIEIAFQHNTRVGCAIAKRLP